MHYVDADYAALQNNQYCACWSDWSCKAKALLSCNGRIFWVESMRNRETTQNATKSTIESIELFPNGGVTIKEVRGLLHIEQEVCSARRDPVPVHADQEKWSFTSKCQFHGHIRGLSNMTPWACQISRFCIAMLQVCVYYLRVLFFALCIWRTLESRPEPQNWKEHSQILLQVVPWIAVPKVDHVDPCKLCVV